MQTDLKDIFTKSTLIQITQCQSSVWSKHKTSHQVWRVILFTWLIKGFSKSDRNNQQILGINDFMNNKSRIPGILGKNNLGDTYFCMGLLRAQHNLWPKYSFTQYSTIIKCFLLKIIVVPINCFQNKWRTSHRTTEITKCLTHKPRFESFYFWKCFLLKSREAVPLDQRGRAPQATCLHKWDNPQGANTSTFIQLSYHNMGLLSHDMHQAPTTYSCAQWNWTLEGILTHNWLQLLRHDPFNKDLSVW